MLITDRSDARQTPVAELKQADDEWVLRLRTVDEQATLRLPAAAQGGGVLEVGGPNSLTWSLPIVVQADGPLVVAGQ